MSRGCAATRFGMRTGGDAFMWPAVKQVLTVHRTYKYPFFSVCSGV